jgi:serine protease Do
MNLMEAVSTATTRIIRSLSSTVTIPEDNCCRKFTAMNGICRLRASLSWIVLVGTLPLVAHAIDGDEENLYAEAVSDSYAERLSDDFHIAAKRASPAVVMIYALKGPHVTAPWRQREAENGEASIATHDPLFARQPRNEQGSGIIIDRKGLILTCRHIIDSANVVFVILPDGRKFEPTQIRSDPATDLAVIQIEGAEDLCAVQLGNSARVKVGDFVVSLGNPYELKHSVSAGIVSATDRMVPGIPIPLIQNDAATNPGSSGGALLNLHGDVVGIITASIGLFDGFQGIGLAIPANTAKRIVDGLGKSEEIRRAYMGCQTQMLSSEIAQQLGLPTTGGLYVKDVEDQSPIALGGIREGDIITHFAGKPINPSFQLRQSVENLIPGVKYGFTVFRNGDSLIFDVEMGQLPHDSSILDRPTRILSMRPSEHIDELLGLGLDNLTPDVARQLGFPSELEGALVTNVVIGNEAYKEGVAAGMVVLRINSSVIRDIEDFRNAMNLYLEDKVILMLVQSNEGKYLATFKRWDRNDVKYQRRTGSDATKRSAARQL